MASSCLPGKRGLRRETSRGKARSVPGLLAGSSMSSDPLAGQPADSAVPGRRPLDILIVTSEAPPIVSGISTCIDRLATGLVARQHRVRVLSCAQIRRIVFGEWRLSSFVAHWPQIVRQLRHFDVVNVHGPVPTMSDVFLWLSSWLPSYARPAIVYTHHSPIDIRGASRISMRYNKLHQGLALRADRIVASSPHYARQHRSRYGPVVRAIPWGVDPQAGTAGPGPAVRRGAERAVRRADAALQGGGDAAGRRGRSGVAEAHLGGRRGRARQVPEPRGTAARRQRPVHRTGVGRGATAPVRDRRRGGAALGHPRGGLRAGPDRGHGGRMRPGGVRPSRVSGT